ASGLAQDVEVGVVLMHLPLGNLHAPGAARLPFCRQHAVLEVAAVRLSELRAHDGRGEKQEHEWDADAAHDLLLEQLHGTPGGREPRALRRLASSEMR